MRVGFDSDGVLDNFGEGVRETLVARGLGHLWKSGPTPEPYWNFYEDWEKEDGARYTFADFKELVDWGVDNGYIFTGHWRPNAVRTVNRVKAMGHTTVVATDRFFGTDPANSERNTRAAFAAAGFQIDEFHFTRDKCSVEVDTMVEDKLENYDALVAKGVPTWLINRPWNKVRGGDGRRRIADIRDYGNAIQVITDQRAVDLQLA